MKKCFCGIVLLCAVLILVSCSGKPVTDGSHLAKRLTSPFTASVNVKYKNVSFSAKVTKMLRGYCDIVFTAPKALEGLTVSFKENDAEISYDGLSFTLTPGEISSHAAANLLFNSLESVFSDLAEASSENGYPTVNFAQDGALFTMRFDAENGTLLSINSDSEKFFAEFYDFNPIKTEN